VRIGVIGSGNIGATAARLFLAAGHEVAIANSRGPDSLGELVGELGHGSRAATVDEAAGFGELVLVAIPMRAHRDLPADRLAGRVVVDANNYYAARDGQIAALDSNETTSSDLLAQHIGPGARVVKAFNTMTSTALGTTGRPDAPLEERPVLFLAGNDEEAKATVAALIEELGFAPVDTGSLAVGRRRQQPGGDLYNAPMRLSEARARLGQT
jgi:predicted dinucleotide-binding enzyme